jgi:hypothetical protein
LNTKIGGNWKYPELTWTQLRTHTTIKTPKNVQLVERQLNDHQDPLSPWKHAVVLGILDHSLRKILHEDFSFHPSKSMLVRELNFTDFVATRSISILLEL